jgi:hypothetical protein
MAVIKRNRFPALLKKGTGLPLPAVTRSTDANAEGVYKPFPLSGFYDYQATL